MITKQDAQELLKQIENRLNLDTRFSNTYRKIVLAIVTSVLEDEQTKKK
jgi:hypothetical protein